MVKKIKDKEVSSLDGKSEVVVGIPDGVSIDKVGNVEQKEFRLSEAGVTRRFVYSKLRELLTATRREKSYDEEGNEVWAEVSDLVMQARGVEMGLKLFGDMKDGVQVNTQVNNVFDVSELVRKAKENRERRSGK